MKKSNRRLACLCAAVGMVLTGVTACSNGAGSAESKAESRELTVLLPPWAEPSEELITAFETENNAAVNLNIMGWDDIHDKITIAAVSKVAPADVMEIDWSWAKEFVNADCIEPLTLTDEQKTQYPLYTSFEVDGVLTAVPYSNDIRVGYYNEEHLLAAQIEKAPETWEELIEDCKKIKEAGICEYPLSFTLSATENSATQLIWLALSQGGMIFNEDDTINEACMADTLKFVDKCLNEVNIIDPGAISFTDVEAGNVYRKGTNTFVIGTLGTMATCNDPEQSSVVGKIKPMLIPGTAGLRTATCGMPEGIGISKYSENKELAQIFIDWYVGEEVQNDLFHKHGTVPTNIDTFKKLGDAGEIEGQEVMIEEMKAYKSPFPNGVPAWYSEYSSITANKLNALAQGTVTPEEAAQQITEGVGNIEK